LEPTADNGNFSNAVNVIEGSAANYVLPGTHGATISGGGAPFYFGTGMPNSVTTDFGTVGGGAGNTASGSVSVIGGGFGNTASGGTTSMGTFASTTVGGGSFNTASSPYATVGGGYNNVASGYASTVAGGLYNTASGAFSFAAGAGAQAFNDNCFVWSDSTNYYSSDRDQQFKIQAGGGMVLDVSGSSGHNPAAFKINSTSSDGEALFATQDSSNPTAELANSGTGDLIKGFSGPSANTVVFEVVNDGTVYVKGVALTSDRNAKTNFASLNARTLLAQVAALPISEWNYKDDSSATRHIGPMAQDFHAAFGLNGSDDKHISTVDEGGVALAAIQALNQKLEKESKDKDAQIQQLNQRLEKLEQLLTRDNVALK
jgi:hypothetical protein